MRRQTERWWIVEDLGPRRQRNAELLELFAQERERANAQSIVPGFRSASIIKAVEVCSALPIRSVVVFRRTLGNAPCAAELTAAGPGISSTWAGGCVTF